MAMFQLTALNQIQFPFSFLVALGTLEVVSRAVTDRPMTLRWEKTPLWTAVIDGPESEEAIIQTVAKAANNISSDPLWGFTDTDGAMQLGINKILPSVFRDRVEPHGWDPTSSLAWASLLTEWPQQQKKNKDFIDTSALHLLVGGQTNQFLEFVRCDAAFATQKSAAFREALWGPWKFTDKIGTFNETSFGWSTRAIPNGARTTQKPETIKKTGTAGTIWLAAEGLRCLPTWNGHQQAITATIDPRNSNWTLPIWDDPLRISEVRRLLIGFDVNDLTTWHERGIRDAFESIIAHGLLTGFSRHYTPAIPVNRREP